MVFGHGFDSRLLHYKSLVSTRLFIFCVVFRVAFVQKLKREYHFVEWFVLDGNTFILLEKRSRIAMKKILDEG